MQGRNGGVESLSMKHVADLLRKDYALNNQFKSSASHKYQPFLISKRSKEMFQIYLDLLRPAVAPHKKITPDMPLWLTFNGVPMDGKIGRLIKAYFRDYDLDISSTRLRGLLETASYQKYRAGEISSVQQNAISFISGHGGRTARDYYVRSNIHDDIIRARNAHRIITGAGIEEDHNDIDQRHEQEGDEADEGIVYAADVWASLECGNHPSPVSARKAIWTEQEQQYLLDAVEDVKRECGNRTQYNLFSIIKKRIFADPATREIFHHRHVLNTDRLRGGIRKFIDQPNN